MQKRQTKRSNAKAKAPELEVINISDTEKKQDDDDECLKGLEDFSSSTGTSHSLKELRRKITEAAGRQEEEWEQARKEFQLYHFYQLPQGQCACNHQPITNRFILMHVANKTKVQIGSYCINHFVDWASSSHIDRWMQKAMNALYRIRILPRNRMANMELLSLARNMSVLTEKQLNTYTNIIAHHLSMRFLTDQESAMVYRLNRFIGAVFIHTRSAICEGCQQKMQLKLSLYDEVTMTCGKSSCKHAGKAISLDLPDLLRIPDDKVEEYLNGLTEKRQVTRIVNKAREATEVSEARAEREEGTPDNSEDEGGADDIVSDDTDTEEEASSYTPPASDGEEEEDDIADFIDDKMEEEKAKHQHSDSEEEAEFSNDMDLEDDPRESSRTSRITRLRSKQMQKTKPNPTPAPTRASRDDQHARSTEQIFLVDRMDRVRDASSSPEPVPAASTSSSSSSPSIVETKGKGKRALKDIAKKEPLLKKKKVEIESSPPQAPAPSATATVVSEITLAKNTPSCLVGGVVTDCVFDSPTEYVFNHNIKNVNNILVKGYITVTLPDTRVMNVDALGHDAAGKAFKTAWLQQLKNGFVSPVQPYLNLRGYIIESATHKENILNSISFRKGKDIITLTPYIDFFGDYKELLTSKIGFKEIKKNPAPQAPSAAQLERVHSEQLVTAMAKEQLAVCLSQILRLSKPEDRPWILDALHKI